MAMEPPATAPGRTEAAEGEDLLGELGDAVQSAPTTARAQTAPGGEAAQKRRESMIGLTNHAQSVGFNAVMLAKAQHDLNTNAEIKKALAVSKKEMVKLKKERKKTSPGKLVFIDRQIKALQEKIDGVKVGPHPPPRTAVCGLTAPQGRDKRSRDRRLGREAGQTPGRGPELEGQGHRHRAGNDDAQGWQLMVGHGADGG